MRMLLDSESRPRSVGFKPLATLCLLVIPWYHFYKCGVLNNEFQEGGLSKICSKNTLVGRGLMCFLISIERMVNLTIVFDFNPVTYVLKFTGHLNSMEYFFEWLKPN